MALLFLLVSSAALVPPPEVPVTLCRRPVSALAFTGADRHRFLHGLCTADVEAMKSGGGRTAAIVDAAGMTLDVITVVDGAKDGALIALTDQSRGADLLAFFDKYIFPADDVAVADVSGEFSCFEVLGPKAGKFCFALSEELPPPPLPEPGDALRFAPSMLVVGESILGSGDTRSFSLVTSSTSSSSSSASSASDESLEEALRSAVLNAGGAIAPSWHALRIRRGLPARGSEFGAPHAPKASPLSLGLWDTVDPDKVCAPFHSP